MPTSKSFNLQPRTESPTRIFIYGGCVSRDSIEFANTSVSDSAPRFEVAKYVARSSLLAVGTDASNLFDDLRLKSKFQQRMLEGDVFGSLLNECKIIRGCDLMIWDLNVERLGVWITPDGGVVTNSTELKRCPSYSKGQQVSRFIGFGEAEHFMRWQSAASIFVSYLGLLGVKHKLIIIAPNWAVKDEKGKPLKRSSLQPQSFNAAVQPYLSHLEALGLPVVRIEETVASTDHKWGLAPFHYTESTYREVVDAISDFISKL